MRWFLGGAVLGFLAVQAALSWTSLHPADTRDEFARAMYSDSYVCSARFELELAGGDRVQLPIVSFSGGRDRAATARDVPDAFRSWMCSRFTTGAEAVRARGGLDCRASLDRFRESPGPAFCEDAAFGGV